MYVGSKVKKEAKIVVLQSTRGPLSFRSQSNFMLSVKRTTDPCGEHLLEGFLDGFI